MSEPRHERDGMAIRLVRFVLPSNLYEGFDRSNGSERDQEILHVSSASFQLTTSAALATSRHGDRDLPIRRHAQESRPVSVKDAACPPLTRALYYKSVA